VQRDHRPVQLRERHTRSRRLVLAAAARDAHRQLECVAGGRVLAGGVLLEQLGAMSGEIQKIVLRLAYLVAIARALLPFLNLESITH
jgi:hypothetical protein